MIYLIKRCKDVLDQILGQISRALHLHRYYREAFGYARDDLPNAAWISDRTLSLPLSPKLTDDDVEDVLFAVRRTLEHFAQ